MRRIIYSYTDTAEKIGTRLDVQFVTFPDDDPGVFDKHADLATPGGRSVPLYYDPNTGGFLGYDDKDALLKNPAHNPDLTILEALKYLTTGEMP